MRDAAAVAGAFSAAYGRSATCVWAAPGRVNLIGEHTDYTGGLALPMALPLGVVCAAAPREDGVLRVRSAQVPGEGVSVAAEALAPGGVSGWAAYALGSAWALRDQGHTVPGADLLVDGDVPLGSGLSSSAALTCAVLLALADLVGAPLEPGTAAALARRAETDVVGAPTGVLDQLAAVHGRDGAALLVDARARSVEPVPLDLRGSGLALLVVDTRTPHRHADGAYAERRRECAEAERLLGVRALRDAEPAWTDRPAWRAMPPVLQARARHVVTENARVRDVVALLRSGVDPRRTGPLLTASHVSLREDFAVTVPALDVAVDAALGAGAHGARMTGGGFGGCVVALVEEPATDEVTAAVTRAFDARGFAPPRAFVAHPSPGARRLR